MGSSPVSETMWITNWREKIRLLFQGCPSILLSPIPLLHPFPLPHSPTPTPTAPCLLCNPGLEAISLDL